MHTLQTTLSNGIRVISSNIPNFLSAQVVVVVNTGSRDEGLEDSGTAHFLEHCIFKNTSTRTSLQISSEIESLGSSINAYTSDDQTAYYINGLGENIPQAVSILGDIVCNSLFLQSDIDTEIGVVLQEIAQYEDNKDSLAYDGFGLKAYPEQSLGRPILGQADFVKQIKSKHLHDFVENNYSTQEIIVVAAGCVHHQNLVQLVEQHFPVGGNSLIRNFNRPGRIPATYGGGVAINRSTPFEQVASIIGFDAPNVCHADAMATSVLTSMLGGGMSSPLFQEIREKRGLVYSVGSYASQSFDNGSMLISGGTTPANLVQYFDAVRETLIDFAENPQQCDLDRAKNTLTVRYATKNEDISQITGFIASTVFNHGKVMLPASKIEQVRAVTLDDVKRVSNQIIMGKPTISVVGNLTDDMMHVVENFQV